MTSLVSVPLQRHVPSPLDRFEPDGFGLPWFSADSAWLGHIPFARWLVSALQPERVVELGVFTGASFLAFCHAADRLGIGTRCYGVDTWTGDEHTGPYSELVFRRLTEYIQLHHQSGIELMRMTFDEAAERFADGSIDLLHIDGLHYYEAVKHDFDTWRPKMSARGIVLFHDIAFKDRGFGVYRLWEELAATYPHFAFEHSFGLGVIGVGDDVPADLRPLFETKSEDEVEKIRHHFTEQSNEILAKMVPPPLSLRIMYLLGKRDSAVRAWRHLRQPATPSSRR